MLIGKYLISWYWYVLAWYVYWYVLVYIVQIPLLPLQHCHAAGALLLARWQSGAECLLGVAAEGDRLLDSTPHFKG